MAHSEDTGGAPDTEQLYDLCKTTEKGLADIATGLGQIGAAPDAIKSVQQMGTIVGKICDGLAKSMKEEPAEPAHTMDSAADEMMAERRAAAQQA
jgi:hypothetical protein